jgi:hypothetical protein
MGVTIPLRGCLDNEADLSDGAQDTPSFDDPLLLKGTWERVTVQGGWRLVRQRVWERHRKVWQRQLVVVHGLSSDESAA